MRQFFGQTRVLGCCVIDKVFGQRSRGDLENAATGAAADQAEAFVGPAEPVRGDDGLLCQCQQPLVLGDGLLFEYVETGPGDRSSFEGVGQCLLVDDRAAGGIDEVGAFFHQREFAFADQVMGLFSEGAADADVVRALQQRIEREP